MLRARNIRTLAEAETACRAILDEAPRGLRTGWIVPGRESEAADSTPALARLDSFPYRHRVRDVMSTPAVTVAGNPLRAKLAWPWPSSTSFHNSLP